MTSPLPLPLRVLVKGASTPNWTSPMSGPRTDLAYPRALEAALHAAGRPAQVRDTSFAAERTNQLVRSWQRDVVGWSPDVVVLHYGHMESIHLLLPQRLERHANSLTNRPGPVRDVYRAKVIGPLWKSMARAQRSLDGRIEPTLMRHRPRRVASDLGAVVERIQQIGSPLILIPEILHASEHWLRWFPGMNERVDVMNAALADVVRRAGRDEVRIFPTRTVLADLLLSGEDATPDGGHFSPRAHRLVGEALCAEILAWSGLPPVQP